MKAYLCSGLGLACVVALVGCGRTLPYVPGPAEDGGADAAIADARMDAPRDARVDAPNDARVDMPVGVPGIIVTPTMGLMTSEMGGTATFTVVLASPPSMSVVVALASSDTSEGTVAPASLTFTTINWNAPQVVTVTGVDDPIGDGPVAYSIVTAPASSGDIRYSGLNAADVAVTNIDDETAGITVTPTSVLETDEAGAVATFTIRLNTAPTANVTISLSSSNIAEGHVSPASVEFTPASWSSPITVTVTGVDDSVADGDQPYTIDTAPAVSADPTYSGLDAENVSLINLDNEMPGILVDPTVGLTTTEVGGTATFTVALRSQPAADVMIPVVVSDDTEGVLSTMTVNFTTMNWNVPQAVTVTGQDDAVADGDQLYTVQVGPSTSTDLAYSGLSGAAVNLTNSDNETPGITATSSAGLNTTESGGTATFTVLLDSMPSADVTITLTSSNLAEGTVAPASLTFTPLDWNIAQTVTLTGVDDPVADGSQPYQVTLHVSASADPDYLALADILVNVSNTDNETPSITVSPTLGLLTNESGATATFTIVLSSQPTADVTIPVASDTPSEGSVSPAFVTLTAATWNVPQLVTVTGVNDSIADGSRVFSIITGAATSADLNYDGQNPDDVQVTNADNDVVGITVSPTSIVAAEGGAPGTFTLALTSQPTADVTISLSILDGSQGMASPASLTFTPADWNTPQTVTVVAVNDLVADGSVVGSIITEAATSTDMGYSGFDPANVTVTFTDNDVASVVVAPTSGLTTSEAFASAMFTVVLTSQPTADITVPLASNNTAEGTVAPAMLTFTALNWNVPQAVTVTGANDNIVDGTVAYTVSVGPAISSDLVYNGLTASSVSLSNSDNDTGAISVSPTSGLMVTEAGTSATFTIVLTVQTAADVTVGLSVNDTTEVSISPSSVTFTASTWNVPQTVTVTGVSDGLSDLDQTWIALTAASTSTLAGYSGINPSDVSGVTLDTDSQRCVSCDNSYVARGGFGPPIGMTSFLSQTGRYVVFLSNASNLVSGDTNMSTDVFVRDRQTATVSRVNLTSAGAESPSGCSAGYASISLDGRYVAMSCSSNDLVAGDTNGAYDVFLRDRTLGTTARVSLSEAGTELTGFSITPTVSSDGRYVAFVSNASNAVAGDTNGIQDVFVRDTVSNTTTRATITSTGTQVTGGGTISGLVISANGRYVAFAHIASLDAADTNAVADIYVRDLTMATTTRVSVATGGGQATGGGSTFPSISPDGRYVSFQSTATNLVIGDTNAASDIFLRDTMGATTTRVSISNTGVEGTGASTMSSVSDDGRYVAFVSLAANLIATDTDGFLDLFVRDNTNSTTKLISRTLLGALPNAAVLSSYAIGIAGNGSVAAFTSNATNLISNDLNVGSDVFAVPAP
jgi:hypothetical protein